MNTTIILTPLDAELFKKFQQYHHVIELMDKHGILDIKYGKATFNISGGIIQNVIKEEMVYSAKYS